MSHFGLTGCVWTGSEIFVFSGLGWVSYWVGLVGSGQGWPRVGYGLDPSMDFIGLDWIWKHAPVYKFGLTGWSSWVWNGSEIFVFSGLGWVDQKIETPGQLWWREFNSAPYRRIRLHVCRLSGEWTRNDGRNWNRLQYMELIRSRRRNMSLTNYRVFVIFSLEKLRIA